MDAIAIRFEEFDQENPHVYEEIFEIASTAKTNGVDRLGIATIFEVMRYNVAIRTKGDRFKLNNNFRAMYVRKLVEEYPQFTNMFETRERPSAK